MKKGFLLVLLVVTMLAITLPAAALAPIVTPLPDIVIGDAEDVSGSLRLMRYLDVARFDATRFIETRNGTATLEVYYSSYTNPADWDNSVKVKASTDTVIKDPVNGAQRASLAAGLSPGVAAKQLNAGGFAYLSLINSVINDSAGTPATDAYSATAATNGVDPAAYPAGYGDTTTMIIHALQSGKLGNGTFLVYSTTGASDAFGAASNPVIPAMAGAVGDFTAGNPGWVNIFFWRCSRRVCRHTWRISGRIGPCFPGRGKCAARFRFDAVGHKRC